jgi:lipopolysaccharide export system permease protein
MVTVTERQPLSLLGLKWRLPILDRYLLKEMLLPFFGGLGIFYAFWALNIFFLAADYIINQHAPFFLALRFVVLRIPQATPMAFPTGCLFAGLLALGRVAGDNEIVAMRTSGIPVWRIVLTPMLFGVAMFLISYATNEVIAPWSVDQSTRTFYQMLYRTDSLPVEPQFFRKDSETGNVFYVTSVAPDGKTMEGVQIFKPARLGPWTETLQAKTAIVEHAALALQDVIDTRFNAEGYVTSQQKVKQIYIGLPLAETAAEFMSSQNSDPYTMSTKRLSQQVASLQAQGQGGPTVGMLQISLADKFAWPFSSIIAMILGLPLALRFGRRGMLLAFAVGIVAFVLYFLAMSACAALGRNDAINPYLAAWLPNIFFGITGIVLLWLEEH